MARSVETRRGLAPQKCQNMFAQLFCKMSRHALPYVVMLCASNTWGDLIDWIHTSIISLDDQNRGLPAATNMNP